jgi:hypothetical protein
MRLVNAANRAAYKSDFYRRSRILVVPANKAPFNDIPAMWKAGWRMMLVHKSRRGTYYYCYKRRGFLPTLWASLLTLFQ